jgi:gliding motility-associated-like protein
VDGNTYTSSGTYAFVTACNTETLELTITPSTNNTTTITACDTYTWAVDGNTYTSSGTYTFVTACNTETLELTITPSANNTTTISACDTYTWAVDGNTYTSSGTYTFVNGCNTETLDLTINNLVTSVDVQIAIGNFTWIDGITYTNSTNTPTYTISNGSSNGCDSTITLNLTIYNNVTASDIQVACDEFTWIDGITYLNSTNSPTFTFPGGSYTGADSTVVLNLTIYQSITINTNAIICDGQTYTLPSGTTINAAGQYIDTLTTINGCDSVIQVVLSVLGVHHDTLYGSVCNSQPYQLPNGTLVNTPGTYDMNYTNQNGCDSIITIVLNDGANLNATVQIVASPSGIICEGEAVTFTAGSINGGSAPTYQWYVNGIPIQGQNMNEFTSFSLNNNDTVSVQLVSNEPCVINPIVFSNSIIQQVSVPVNVSVSIFTTQQFPACSDRPITFTAFTVNAGNNPIYQWYVNGLPVMGGNNDTLIIDSLSNNDIVTLNVYSSLDCIINPVAYSNSIVVTLIQSISPTIYITADDSIICEQQPINFTAHINGAGSSLINYHWMVNNILVAITEDSIFTYSNFSNLDSVTCQLVSSYICVNPPIIVSNPISIIVNPNPLIDMINYEYRHNICDTLQLIATTNISNPIYEWRGDAYISCYNCVSTNTSTKNDTTWYYFTVIDTENGCFNIDSTVVILNPEPEASLPTAFSPNGDDNNDILFIRGSCVKEVSLKVYDRWGELVFQTQTTSVGWDGNFKGSPAAAGVYVYVLDYVLFNDQIKNSKGNVTLIR